MNPHTTLIDRTFKGGENLSYQVIVTSPDGRFGTHIIEGGLNKKTALFEARKCREMGQIVKVFDKENRKFL